MTVLENDYLKVAISTKGAQLTTFYNKATNVEQLWQADAEVWPWHAPNLFPIVGAVINNELLVEGKAYPMKRHGIARTSEFILLESDQYHAVFSLPSSEEVKAVYPYNFDFQVMYSLMDNALRVTYKMINHDHKMVYFSVGAHPAFNVPFNKGENYEDYYLEFEAGEKLERHLISTEGFFTGETRPVPLDGNKLFLKRDMFDEDALVFKYLKSRQVTLRSTKHDDSISVEYPHFNYLGIWAKPGTDFVCIEPWLGCTDTQNEPKDISQKENIQKVKTGHVFEASFFISI